MTDTVATIDAEPEFDENEAAVIEAFVVPTYLRLYWESCRDMLLVGEASRVVQLGALTGYPGPELLQRMPNTTGVGVERSESCALLAAGKQPPELFTYLVGDPAHTGLSTATFSHAFVLHPTGSVDYRTRIFAEASRLLYPGGQALIALPLSRSFPEVLDLIGEFGLKFDDAAISAALEQAAAERVTVESLSNELEAAGFVDIDFELHHDVLAYDSGRAFLEDPAVRYFIGPQIEAWLDQLDLAPALEYVARAIDKYWSDTRMEMGVTVAAFSARR